MRELTSVTRTKKTYHITNQEFFSGEWLKKIPKSNKLEVTFTGNNGILVVKDMPYVKTRDEKSEGEKNGRK